MARREITLDAGGRAWTLRFSCAAARALDPEGTMDFGEVVRGLRRPAFLQRATLAALTASQVKGSPPYSDADAAALIDAAGVQPVADAVSEVVMEWWHPGIDLVKPEGSGGPKA